VIASSAFRERPIDLEAVPWSRRGSYMSLSMNTQSRDHPGREHPIDPGLYLCDVGGYRLWRWNGVFRIVGLSDGEPAPLTVIEARPTFLRLAAGDGEVEVTSDGPDTIRFRAKSAGLRFVQSVIDPMDAALAFPVNSSTWRLQMGEDAHYAMSCLDGRLVVDAPRVRTGSGDTDDRKVIELVPNAEGRAELAITQYRTGYRPPLAWASFEAAMTESAADLESWAAAFPAVTSDLQSARDAAISLLWANTVAARDNLRRPAVLMSKNWMHAVWSWDHCFVALGLAQGDPALAWDQFMLFFDRQSPDGMLADIITDYGCIWGFCKPPVHGWTLRQLISAGAVPTGGLEEVYPHLAAWTNWWLTCRDDDGDGLAEYFHGCDSGQDNSAAFDEIGFPAASPDLAAFLVVQMDVLSDIAALIGRSEESATWRSRADQQLRVLIEGLWEETHFVVRRGGDGAVAHNPFSQVFYLPLILGERLPETVRTALLAEVDAVITPHGVASEGPGSPLHESDGYWRGPIWAPTTNLILSGLAACGDRARADALGRGFAAMAQAGGFAENYEATSGQPLRDRGYSWSAAVFLHIASTIADQRP
jgi:putative isomerase